MKSKKNVRYIKKKFEIDLKVRDHCIIQENLEKLLIAFTIQIIIYL